MNSKARRAAEGKVQFPKFYGVEPKPLQPITEPLTSGGFDIEADAQTADPFLICAAFTDGRRFRKHLRNAEDVLDFLCLPQFTKSINGFWNIGYDSEGMLRFFPDETKYLLSKNPEVYLKHDLSPGSKENYQYHLRLIPKKALFVSHVLGTENKYYDFAQYYGKESLDRVAKRILKEGKKDVDASLSSKHEFLTNPEYRRNMEDYCAHDAYLTARLGSHLITAIHKFLPTKNFTSCASIAEQYVTRNGYYTPQQIRNIYADGLRSYFGGRFELLKRGFIENTHTSDLKSAYPWAMAHMPILTEQMEILRITEGEWHRNALYGTYHIQITVPTDNTYLGPIPVESKGPIIYPTGIFEAWVDKETLTYLDSNGYDYFINQGVEIFDSAAEPRLAKPINTLFSIKENKSEDEGLRMAAKIIMNSIYGKTIQLIDDAEGFIVDLETAIAQNLNIDCVTPSGIFAVRHTGVFKCGTMFNPYYAGFITAKTRIRLLEATAQVKPENLVAFQTDSVTTINTKIPITTGLGGWDYKGQYDLAIGKSGFYQFQKADGTPIETKARSYGKIEDISFPEYRLKRRISLKECAQKSDFTNLNLITYKTIANNINTDSKRLWSEDITYHDLRRGGRTIDSLPLQITPTP